MPTPKQERAAEIVVENSRSNETLPKGEVLARAGYSEAVQTHPERVFGANGFKEALKKYVPDQAKVNVLKRALNAKKRHYYHDKEGGLHWEQEQDHNVQLKAVDMLNKMDGEYAPEQQTTVNVLNMTNVLDALEQE